MDRMESLIDVLKTMIDGEFTGHVKINFTQGSVGRVEKIEELEEAASFAEIWDKGKSKARSAGAPKRYLFDLRNSSFYAIRDQEKTGGSLRTQDGNPFHGDEM